MTASSSPLREAPRATRCQVTGVPEAEHLLARQRHPDGAPQLSGGQHGQEHVVLRAQSRTKGSAHKGRDDTYVGLRVLESAAEVVPDIQDALRLVIDGEAAVFVRNHRGREQLQRVVVFGGIQYSASIWTEAPRKARSA